MPAFIITGAIALMGIALLVVAALLPGPGPRAFPGQDPRVVWIVLGLALLGLGGGWFFRLWQLKLGGMWDERE